MVTHVTAQAAAHPQAGDTDRAGASLYIAVALAAGAVIALQIAVMRIFSVGSWAHFGSLVVSLAMLGFGLTSVVICLAEPWFERHWRGVAGAALAVFAPLAAGANLIAQQVPFNAIFIVSDPAQKWRLAANFALYLVPFVAGALFLGVVFLNYRRTFARVYFADMAGAGLAGLAVLGAMYFVPPEDLILVPVALSALGCIFWFGGLGRLPGLIGAVAVALVAVAMHLYLPGLAGIPSLAVSEYKGVAYARHFPDARRIYRSVSPFGDLQVYASSYLHFAPGLSDNAAFNLPELPANAYLGLYIDGEGPSGIMRKPTALDDAYFRYLPMYYPYLIKKAPETFVVQFGGGISAMVALGSGSRSVTVAEANPAVLEAFASKPLRDFTGDILANPRLTVIPYEGRLFLARTTRRFDIVDLSLADSVGLSNPGGFPIVEKYAYTAEAMQDYMRALKPGGILSVTLWNKEEPPKSVLKLYATMAEAARRLDQADVARSFFAVSSYLSTTTVLYKRGGFSDEEIAALRKHSQSMSFDEIYSPGFAFDDAASANVLANYRAQIFGDGTDAGDQQATSTSPDSTSGLDNVPATSDNPSPDAPAEVLPSTIVGRLAWHSLIDGGWRDMAGAYVFDIGALSNDRPYFAAYVRPGDLPRTLGRLDLFQDDWGYLVLWATLAIAGVAAAWLVILPVLLRWRFVFARYPGKLGSIVYFACLGLGYIMVEVGLIGRLMLALSNATVSASVAITGMLVFSGLGSLASERILSRARHILPVILLVTGGLLAAYGALLDPVLNWIGLNAYGARLFYCLVLIAPPAFLMGFPMPTAMTSLGRLGKSTMFVWAWGINGCFSVIGAAAVPIIATQFGLSAVLELAGLLYVVAIAAFYSVLKPVARPA